MSLERIRRGFLTGKEKSRQPVATPAVLERTAFVSGRRGIEHKAYIVGLDHKTIVERYVEKQRGKAIVDEITVFREDEINKDDGVRGLGIIGRRTRLYTFTPGL